MKGRHEKLAATKSRRTAPVLYVLDYPGRRPEARVKETHLEAAGFVINDLLDGGLPTSAGPYGYVPTLLEDIDLDTPAHAVLGYCGAGPLAHFAAHLLAQRQAKPPVLVLFDAVPVTWATVLEAFDNALQQIDGGTVHKNVGGMDPEQALVFMHRCLISRARESLGDDADGIAQDWTSRQMDWLTHLVASYCCEPTSWDGEVLHFISREQPTSGDWPGTQKTTVIRLDCARSALLTSPVLRNELVKRLSPRDHSFGET